MSKVSEETASWIRFWAVDQSRQINKYCRDVNRVIDDAKKITAYVLNQQPAAVVKLVTDKAERGEA